MAKELQCQECGKLLNAPKSGRNPKCSGCGSYDIDIAPYGAK